MKTELLYRPLKLPGYSLNLSIRLANPFCSSCSYNQVPDCIKQDQVSRLNFPLNADRPVNLVKYFFLFLVHPEVLEVGPAMSSIP